MVCEQKEKKWKTPITLYYSIGWIDNHLQFTITLISMRPSWLVLPKRFDLTRFVKAKRCVFTMRMCHVKEFLCCVVFVFMILTCADDYSAFYCFTYFYFYLFLPLFFVLAHTVSCFWFSNKLKHKSFRIFRVLLNVRFFR